MNLLALERVAGNFPVEVVEGGDQAGISSPHSMCELYALHKV